MYLLPTRLALPLPHSVPSLHSRQSDPSLSWWIQLTDKDLRVQETFFAELRTGAVSEKSLVEAREIPGFVG